MSTEIERFFLPDGTEVGTGLLLADDESKKVQSSYPVYGEEFYLDAKDIEKSLKNDTYKTFRRIRSPWVQNQGQIGQCNASATVAAFHNRRLTDGMAHVALSSNYLYMHINGGRDQGSQLVHGLEFSKKGLAPRELIVDGQKKLFPATVFSTRQVPTALLRAAAAAAPTYQSFEAYRLPSDDYATFKIALASALARDHQVIHAWHVGRNSMNLRNGYVQVARGVGNHATLFHSAKWVGGQDLVHPDCQNSWGPSKNALYGQVSREGWGEDGFGLFTMSDAFACSSTHVFWVLPGNKIKGLAK